MATYKLIQDIEAEDKILGPLTLRQFIFALIAAFFFYMCFFLVTQHMGFLLVLFLPPALFFGFFALPLGRDQPTEVWALAKLRFYFKPRQRIWNQSGVKEFVTITAPKRVERVLTNGLSQTEVTSRLRALADTIDTRGWAVKNVNVNAFTTPLPMIAGSSDRLIDLGSMPQEVQDSGVTAADDILDENNNPIAQQFASMINRSEQAHRQKIVAQLNDTSTPGQPAATSNDYWFMNDGQPATAMPLAPAQVAQINPEEEAAIVSQLKTQAAAHPTPYAHLRTVRPISGTPQPAPPAAPATPAPTMPLTPDPAIISLANNDDLNVATLAHEAKRAKDEGQSQDEVFISLR